MEASVVTTSSGNTGPLGQPRGIGFGILLYIVTLGFYGWYWVYKTEEEMGKHGGGARRRARPRHLDPHPAGDGLRDPVGDREDVPEGRAGAAAQRLDRPLALPGRESSSSRPSSGS